MKQLYAITIQELNALNRMSLNKMPLNKMPLNKMT